MKVYKDLLVWQKSVKFVIEIYKITKLFPQDETYGLSSQMRRAAVSIPSNIAEGSSRNGSKEFFGEGRLYELLRQTREKPVEQAVHDVVEGFRQWLGDTRPPDDITLMIVESQ